MKNLHLRQRLLVLSLLPSLVISSLLVAYFTFSGIRALENELHKSGLAAVRYLAPISEYGIIAGQNDALYSLVQASLQQPSVKSAMVVNKKGRTIAVSGRVSLDADVYQKALSAPGLVAETDAWVAFGAPVLRSTSELDPIFDSLVPPSPNQSETIGYVFIELDKMELRHAQRDSLLRGMAIIVLGMMAIYFLTIGIAEQIAHPILRLVDAVRAMGQGGLETRVRQDSQGEMGELEKGFNDMAAHIEEVHHSMQARIQEATAQLAFQASHDALTGLLNRREFENRLERLLHSVQASLGEAAFLFIDLDRFKPVNDSCGHLAGDQLLQQISQLLQGRLREGDTLARLGGDEFGILLPQCSGPAARQVANDLCHLVGAYRFIWQDKVFAVGASIGLTTITPEVRKLNDILAAADAACYRAKEAGRNQVAEQEVSMTGERRQENNDWPERILEALDTGRLVVEAHPIRDLNPSGEPIFRVELAARLNEPGRAAVSISTLLDAAERYELSPRIDALLLETAVSMLARARRAEKTIHCLLPVSPTFLRQPENLTLMERVLARIDGQGEGLYLILSEDNANRHIGEVVQFARQLALWNCRIVLDDFGGSLNAFNQLQTLKPAYIKLNQSLTRDINESTASTALLRAVVEIASDMGIQTMANQVDTLDALANLAQLEVDCALGRAVGPNEPYEAWLEGAVIRGKLLS